MSKKTASNEKKSFNIDFESLLANEFLDEDDKDCGDLSPPDSWDQIKKLKCDTTSNGKEALKTDGKRKNAKGTKKSNKGEDVFKFFESVGNDFKHSIENKKSRLTQFTKTVASLYETKVGEMLKKQQEEFEKFKNDVANNIKDEFLKFESEFDKIRQQENKLTKILEQQIKLIHKASSMQEEWIEHLADLHKNMVQEFEKVRNKQRNEALEMTKSINLEIIKLQNDFIAETKNAELETIKKHFTSFYF